MSIAAPECITVTDLKFPIQNKIQVFKSNEHPKDNCNLLATACSYGLVFVGTPAAEFRVLQLTELTHEKILSGTVPLRNVNLPSEPLQLALSSDHSLLAVDVVANGTPLIYIYHVPSFLSANIVKLQEIRTSSGENVRSRQILWNPVISNMLCVCTENGGLSVYTIKEQQAREFHSLDGSERATCASWSPKGKQIVVGFGNGKLVQYKPDLKPARTIPCPPDIMSGPFDVISVQWLSTYQFAAVFLQKLEDSVPCLFIINAPKAGNSTYINYDDICYSQSSPRQGQIYLQHILPWNLLLVASANSMEVGVLATTETGEAPTWNQWVLDDSCRAELPLTVDKQETFPVGFSLETGCNHQLTIAEVTFPVMPMIHLLSTHGFLVSFNVLNTTSSSVGLCSPPKPASDTSGLSQFKNIDFNSAPPPAYVEKKTDITFSVPTGSTSTPALATKAKSFFSPNTNENNSPTNLFGGGGFGNQNVAIPIAPTFGKAITFGGPGGADSNNKPLAFGGGVTPLFGAPSTGFAPPPAPVSSALPQKSILKTTLIATTQPQQLPPQQQQQQQSKPLITVPPTYTPATAPIQKSDSFGDIQRSGSAMKKVEVNDDNNGIIKSMIKEEIQKFENDLEALLKRSKAIKTNVGTKEESVKIIKNLKELQDLSVQATESTDSLTSDVQALRLGLNEAFAMVAEARSKTSMYNNPSPHQYQESHAMSQSSRRQLANLQNILATNEAQLQIINKQIDAQWSSHQDAVKLNSKNRMHIPSLEVLYQTLSKQQEIINRHKNKLNMLKAKLGMRDTVKNIVETNSRNILMLKDEKVQESAIESLTDSIISMSLSEQIKADANRLTENKMGRLKDLLRHRKIITIKPKRPDRIGLNSEVVREKKNQVRRLNFVAKEKIAIAKPEAQKPVAVSPAGNKRTQEKVKENLIQPVKPVEITPKPAPVATFSSKVPQATGSLFTPLVSTNPVPPSQSSIFAPSSTSSFSFGTPNPIAATKTLAFGSEKKPEKIEPVKPMAVLSFGQKATDAKETISFGDAIPIQKPSPLFGTSAAPTTAATTTSSRDVVVPEPIKSFAPLIPAPTSAPVPAFSIPSSGKSSFSFGASIAVATSTSSSVTNLAMKEDKKPSVTISKVETVKDSETENKENVPKATATKAPLPGLISLLQKVDAPSSSISTPSTISVFSTKPISTIGVFSQSVVTPSTASAFLPTSTDTVPTSTSPFLSAEPKTTGIFSGFSLPSSTTITPSTATESAKEETSSIFAAPKATSAFSFGSAMANIEEKTAAPKVELPKFGIPIPAPVSIIVTSTAVPIQTTSAVLVTTGTTTSASSFSFGAAFGASSVTDSAPIAATTTSTPSSADLAGNIFSSFNICSPSTTPASTAASTNIFGAASSFSIPKSEPSTSIFGGGSAFGSTEPSPSPFGPSTAETKPAETTNIFGSLPKPEASAFGTQSMLQTPFGGGGGSIFGTSAATSGSPSIFGGGSNVASPVASGSLFGNPDTSASAFGGTPSIFSGSSAQNASAGGSLFGTSSAFGSATPLTGNVFGSPSANNTAGAGAPFSTSVFGQPISSPNASSIFGGGSSAFGQTAGGFNSPSGNFSQNTVSTVSESGFASPQTSAFNKPAFGAASAFGGNAAFGAAPTFGGAPSFGTASAFGTPKPSFGGFQTVPNPMGSPTQSNSLFEQLGSSQAGIGFGNLANQQAQKPAEFGGSSFSSWR